MRGAVLHAPGDVRLEVRDDPRERPPEGPLSVVPLSGSNV